jgi:hypothetical protein
MAMTVPSSSRPFPDVFYHPSQHRPQSPRRPHGRWIWTISGLIVIALMCAWGSMLLSRPNVIRALPMGVKTRTVVVSVPLTRLSVQTYGGNVQVIGGGSRTRVTERVYYDPQAGPAPAIVNSVSDGQFTLTVPSCETQDCVADYTVTVPSTASVTAVTDGGNATVSGVAGATLDSGGGQVSATSVNGPLIVTSDGGDQELLDVAGSLTDESGGGRVYATSVTGSSIVIVTQGGQLAAQGLSVRTAILNSGGSSVRADFSTAAASVDIATDGGKARVVIPGGPYALTADSGGAAEIVGIPTSPAATSTLTVTTGGSPLMIEPTASALATAPASAGTNQHAAPIPPPAPAAPGR